MGELGQPLLMTNDFIWKVKRFFSFYVDAKLVHLCMSSTVYKDYLYSSGAAGIPVTGSPSI